MIFAISPLLLLPAKDYNVLLFVFCDKKRDTLRDVSTGILAKFKGHEYWSKSTCPFYIRMNVVGTTLKPTRSPKLHNEF